MDRVELYDTTLRDGTQAEGISVSVDDKLAITLRLDQLGVSFIEGGYAGANPKDDEFFRRARKLKLKNATLTAFGNTRRAGGDCESDASMRALLEAGTPVVTIVGKASELHVRKVLETSLEENLAMITDSIRFLTANGRRVFCDAEHFFDGYALNPEYAVQAVNAAVEAGAECVILCDTNGGTLPEQAAEAVRAVKAATRARLGIHAHNDSDAAVAVSLAALQAGATQVQGTINGYGERCGNANLVSIIANLQLKMNVKCVSDEQIRSLTELSRFVAEVVNLPPHAYQPYVGSNAFSHKGGLHAAAVEKLAESYQHVPPDVVGNRNALVVSELAGRSTILQQVEELGLGGEITRDDARNIVNHVKAQEARGFAYERAAASFEVLVRRTLPNYEPPFELVDFMVIVQSRHPGAGGSSPANGENLTSEATIKVRVGEHVLHTAAEGNGPVNSLDNALRKALLQFFPHLAVVKLTDYKVRVVADGTGTNAVVRVQIESSDGQHTWHTVGASGNIIEASWLALADSMEYWLLQHTASKGKSPGT
ncbi:MAG: citramalate synthase [SAR202 cluster bacterium]|nr:citramalate synthase [SAR202 cluster bacterium]